MRRVQYIAIALALGWLASPAVASAQEKHWLIGTWSGSMTNYTGSGPGSRTLLVTGVEADGSVRGGWGVKEKPAVGNAKITVSGDNVTVITNENSTVELAHSGDELSGMLTFARARRPFAIQLKKE